MDGHHDRFYGAIRVGPGDEISGGTARFLRATAGVVNLSGGARLARGSDGEDDLDLSS